MAGKILVLGAGGTVGKHLTRMLVAKGEQVKAGTRSGTAIAGAEGTVVDVTDPTSVVAALDGVDRLFLMLPTGNTTPKETLLPLIAAAAERSVKVVFQSVFGADADDSIPYRQAEIALEKAGVPFVILRPNWFADNFHVFWKAGIDHGVIAVPAADGRTSFIDARDIAASAAAALTSDAFDGRAFGLTGPAAVSYGEAAEVLTAALGRPIRYEAVDDEAFVAMLTGAGVPGDYARFLASIFHPVRMGWTGAVTDAVETLTGAPPKDLATYARDNAAALGG